MVWRRLLVAVWLSLGCAEEGPASVEAGPGDVRPLDGGTPEVTGDGPTEATPADLPTDLATPALGKEKVDILFVVDNSGSMAEEQQNLIASFPQFIDELGPGADLDLHVGVVSTDLGAGAMGGNPSCPAPGDDGALCRARGIDRCAACGVQGRYLTTSTPNFAGNVRDVFGCVARLGTSGCGLEHSLGALGRALATPENAGFVRPDAMLALVIITDEDDCTAPADSALFAGPRPGQDWSLRCALEGHLCGGARHDGSSDVDLPLSSCQPASDGALIPIQQLVDAVIAVKGDPRSIVVTAILGWPLPGVEGRYQLGLTAGVAPERTLKPVCSSTANGSATPGLRVKRFAESFPQHGVHSICQNDFREVMRRTAGAIVSAASR